MTYAELDAARKLFGLGERATMGEVKARHRQLLRQCHPDVAKAAGNAERIRAVNAAYQLLAAYLAAYRFSFSAAEFDEQCPEERMRRQFADDPLWGGLNVRPPQR